MAGSPSAVPGIFTIALGRSTDSHRRRTSSIVASASRASAGFTSMETMPSSAPVAS